MSDSRASESIQEIFIRCTHFNFHIIACLRAKKALDMFQVGQLSGESSLIKRSQMVLEWMENNQSLRDIVLQVMKDNEQEHVANLMKGISNGPHIPLSQSRYNRLESITPKLMLIIRNDEELVARLRAMGAISEIDRQDITQVNKEYKRNWTLIEAILRRSDYAFDRLEQALKETLQDHAANYLYEGQVVSVHAKTTQPEKDEVLSELLSRTILEESSEVSSSEQKIFTAINGYSIHPVIAKPGESIVFYFYCKVVDNMITFTELFISGDLQNMMEVIMNRLLLKIDPNHTGQLEARLSLDESEILVVEKFSGISDWMPLTLEEMTAEPNMIYSAETQTEYQIEDGISAEIERITSWSSAESSVGTEIEDVDSDVYAATSRKLYWKQEKRTIYKKFESLLTEEEELLNYFLPEKATTDKGWDWGQRRMILGQKLETLVDVQNYILKLLIPSETSSTGGLRQAVQNIDDKLKQQQQSWKNLKEQVLSELGESKPSTSKPTSSTSIAKIGVRLHEVRYLKYALKKRGELSGKGDLFSALESLVVEVSKEKQQTINVRRADKYLTFSKRSDLPLQLSSDSEDEFLDDYYLTKHWSRTQNEMGLTDLRYESLQLRRSFERTKKENRVLVKQLNETATARLETLNDFIALKAKLEATQNTEENETLKKLLEHQTPTVELPVKFRSDPILVQTIRTKAAEDTKIDIRGLTILDNELFVVTRGSPEVEVFDSRKLSFSRRWNLSELISPQDIGSCSRNKCLYIIDSKCVGQPNEIMRIDPNGKLIKSWLTENDCGWGLSVTDESNVILALQARDKLREYSPDGQLICEINLSTEAGIRSPWRAIKLTNGFFVFGHGHGIDVEHKVSIVDSNGKLQKSFGGTSGSTIAQMRSPRYLSVDSSGFVLVVDHDNSRVLLLDPDLEFRKELLSKEKHGLRFPERILLDESNDRLFVADFDGRGQILIFRLVN